MSPAAAAILNSLKGIILAVVLAAVILTLIACTQNIGPMDRDYVQWTLLFVGYVCAAGIAWAALKWVRRSRATRIAFVITALCQLAFLWLLWQAIAFNA